MWMSIGKDKTPPPDFIFDKDSFSTEFFYRQLAKLGIVLSTVKVNPPTQDGKPDPESRN